MPYAPDPPTVLSGRGAAIPSGPVPPQSGDRLDFFELERSIGIGGMGAVFLANDIRLRREVALKILPAELASDPESVQRFYQEARAAACLDHENIARVYMIGSDKGHHFIAFEYIEGATLRQKIHEAGRLPVTEAVNYTLQVAGALVHASERGVVHRDIKPSNIIITGQGRAKLVDMGLARGFERGSDDAGLTQSGMTLGTFDYISPEQALDPRDVDVRGDLYSLGCTLFHMLAGRPPFPEGTVLQKLRQHEKEPPPDLLAINPAVPPDLAAIVSKLMAKDRDRRYQTPELLIRDLLTTAGALGLRSLSPEGLVWMAPQAAPPWEKHLFWSVPALALVAVLGLFVWWSQPPRASDTPADTKDTMAIAGTQPTSLPPPATKAPSKDETSTPSKAANLAAPLTPRQRPREVTLRSGESLSAAIAREASGSTFILADDGPYSLAPAAIPPAGRRDLTIRAGSDAHPVLKPARGTVSPRDASLLSFGPGYVVIEGVEFQLDAEAGTSWAAIRADRTDLDLRRCSFRASGSLATPSSISAVQIRPSISDADHLGGVSAESCLFDGGLMAFWSRGATDLRIRDTTFGASEPSFWFDNGGATDAVPSELILRHVSARADRGPLIRSAGTRLRAVVEDSVVATSRERSATLVEIDDADRLSWRGKGNLYSGIETYLRVPRDLLGKSRIDDFAAWADDPRSDREALSMTSESPIWESPAARTGRSNSSSSFALATPERPSPDVGARRGPLGRIVSLDEGLATLMGIDPPGVRGSTIPSKASQSRDSTQESEKSVRPPVQPMPAPPVDDLANLGGANLGGAKPSTRITEPQPMDRNVADVPAPMERDPKDPADNVNANPPQKEIVRPADGLIRTATALAAGIERLGARGGTLTIASDADLELPSTEYRGTGRILIQAEEGAMRPTLRFRPGKAARPALLSVLSGSLEIQGIDILLEESAAPEVGDWAAFQVSPGADLALTRTTVTVEGSTPRSAVVEVVNRGSEARLIDDLDVPAGAIRATDCLLRSGGDLISVAAGCRLEAEWTNVVAAARGGLVHGRGQARGGPDGSLHVILRQVTARVFGGLAFLESTADEPNVPLLDILARDVVVATDGDDSPLIRIDGQDGLETLRDRVKWDGQGVQYHRIDTYRRDQTSRPGTMPQKFDRASWDVSVAPREAAPFHGDVKFLKVWAPNRSPETMTRDDATLDPDGPSSTAGPDLKRIPQAPTSRSSLLNPK